MRNETCGPRQKIRILIADDFEPWRVQVRSLLAQQPEWEIIGEACNGIEAVQHAKRLAPEIVLLDIGMPGLNGIDAAHQIRQLRLGAKIIFLTQNRDMDVAQEALSDGAEGYVLKNGTGSELLPAIEAALRGDKFVSQVRVPD